MRDDAGEDPVCKTRPHWIVFGWAVWLASLAAPFFSAANDVANPNDPQMWLGLARTFSVVATTATILA